MSNAIINNWKWEWRNKVKYGGAGNVNMEVETSMRVAWPRMHAMFQDPLHPCFKLEHGLKVKRIESTAKFRQIMAKFSALNTDISSDTWGPFYRCEMDPPPFTRAERTARQHILDLSMCPEKAARMLLDIEPREPFLNRLDFFEYLAAFVVVYPTMSYRRTRDRQRKYMFIYIHGLTCPMNVEYLMNGLRVLHSIPVEWASVLAVGTTSTETVCRRVNKLAVSQQCKYAMAVSTRLRSFWLQSVETFVNATQLPTTRQRRSHHYDLCAQNSFQLTTSEWRQIRMAPHIHQRTTNTVSTHALLKERGCNMHRSESAQKAFRAKNKKRTPFTLLRRPSSNPGARSSGH